MNYFSALDGSKQTLQEAKEYWVCQGTVMASACVTRVNDSESVGMAFLQQMSLISQFCQGHPLWNYVLCNPPNLNVYVRNIQNISFSPLFSILWQGIPISTEKEKYYSQIYLKILPGWHLSYRRWAHLMSRSPQSFTGFIHSVGSCENNLKTWRDDANCL